MRKRRLGLLLLLAGALFWLGQGMWAAAGMGAPSASSASATVTAAKAPAVTAKAPAKAAAKAPAKSTAEASGMASVIPSRPVLAATLAEAAAAAQGQGKAKGKVTRDEVFPAKFQKVAPSEQKAAAKRARALGMKPGIAGLTGIGGIGIAAVQQPDPGGMPHYFGPYGNFAFSPLPRGAITTVSVVDAGTGYTAAPAVTIDDAYLPACSATIVTGCYTPANVTATFAEGAVTGFNIVSAGAGYTAPVVTLTEGGGTGALADAGIGDDPTTTANELTGGLLKFIDPLPGLYDPRSGTPAPAKAIPLGVPDVLTYPGSDYYEIALREYSETMHSQLGPTRLRGYVQTNNGTDLYDATTNTDGCVTAPPIPTGSHLCTAADNNVVPAPIRYLGPVIVAQGRVLGLGAAGSARPVRVKFSNELPVGPPDATGRRPGDLFLPVDETVPGSGYGPALPGTANDKFTQNRATIHLHGNNTVWLSDGNTHQWITPANELTPYPAGTSARSVPDMPGCDAGGRSGNTVLPGNSGCMTFYYTNAQSARLQFYHDHAHGITRLNVYAGEAGGYVLTDAVDQDMINGTNFSGVNINCLDGDDAGTVAGDFPGECSQVLPDVGIPLIIQDRTFVDSTTIFAQDPTWNWGTGLRDADGNITTAVTGDLWFPHVYMTVQNPWDLTGTNAFGKWHYGPWFNPPTPVCPGDGTGAPGCIEAGPVTNPYYQPDPALPNYDPAPLIPGVPNPSSPGEAFLDTPMVNGAAYPFMVVEPRAYRFRILNAANDRFLNLQLYVAGDKNSWTPASTATGSFVPGTANVLCDGTTGVPVGRCTEVKMVPVGVDTPNQFADTPSGVPDPATAGPPWWLIGTEGGFMPKPVVVPSVPVGWNLDMGYFAFGIVNQHSIFLGSAERADVVVDFSRYAGQTLILYNDSPAPVPAGAGVFDFYTGNGNQMDAGGAPNTLPGYGPNTRTIMQIQVGTTVTTPTPDVNLTNLEAVFRKELDSNGTVAKRGVFEVSQDPIIVPQEAYNSAYAANFPSTAAEQFLQIGDLAKTFTPIGGTTPVTIPLEMKAMHDEMGGVYDVMFGRMSGMLGLVNPSSNVHLLIPYPYAGPPVDLVKGSSEGPIEATPMGTLADGTQIWRIFHNGVDTHPIHTHLFHSQIVNRVDQSGQMVGDPVDPIEHGWKDTVRINPLEVTFLAMRPTIPTSDQVPFEVPDSIRLIDPALPEGAQLPPPSPAGWFDPTGFQLEGADIPINHYVNFGWEYVWHCHILSHEEMDMMHALVFAAPPWAPTLDSVLWNGATGGNRNVTVTWTDNSIKEAGFTVQRATKADFTTGLTTFPGPTPGAPTVGASVGVGGSVSFVDTTIANNTRYWYRVLANSEVVGDTGTPNFPTMSADSVSAISAPVDVGTPSTAVPLAPVWSATPATPQAGPQVLLAFTDAANNEAGFVIQRCTVVPPATTCSGSFAQIASLGPRNNTGGVTYTDTTVAFGTTYLYQVAAFNAAGPSAFVPIPAPVLVPAIPAAATDLVVVVTQNVQPNGRFAYTATLNWAPLSWPGGDPTNFTIQRATNLEFTGATSFTVNGTLRSLGPQSVNPNTVYYYRIRANNNIGGSSAWKNARPFPIRTGPAR